MTSISSTAGQLISVKTSFEWELDIDLFISAKPHEVLFSPEFHANSSRWRLELHPKSTVQSSKDYVSLFLRFLSSREPSVTASLILSVVNNRKEKYMYLQATDSSFKPNLDLGFHKFVKREIIFDAIHNVITNDKKVTMMCEIISRPSNQPEVSINLDNLFNSEKFSDVKISVEKKILYAHKNILANKSSVFAAMFEHEMKENRENVIEIKDLDHSVVLELLRFIYTGRVSNIDAVAKRLLIAADKYALIDLKNICSESLCSHLSITNSLEYLHYASLYCVEVLQRKAIDFIVLNIKKIIDLPGFNTILKLPDDVKLRFIRGLAFKKANDIETCVTIED